MTEAESESLSQVGRAETSVDMPVNSRNRFVVPLLIGLHLLITIFLAFRLNIWVDEAFSLHTTAQGVRYALHQALNFELQAPLYFVLLSVWRKLDSSIFAARLFSVASVALSLRVVASMSRRFWKDLHPGWVVAIVAFNPLTIAVAVDIRLYAQVLLLSALLLVTFYDGYLALVPSRRARIYYILLAIASLYTQYYLGFLLAGNACALLALRRWRPLLQYVVGMVLAGLCFVPMVPFIQYQMSAHTAPIQNPGTMLVVFKAITWRMKFYLLPIGWDFTLEIRSWVLRGCYLAGFIILYRNRKRFTDDVVALWTTTVVIAMCFLVIARLQGETLLQARHTIALFLPVNFAVVSLAMMAGNRRVVHCWVVLVLMFSFTGLYVYSKPMAKPGDWHRVGEYLMAHEKPDQPVLVFHAGAALPLSFYYTGSNVLVPVPRENTFERFDFHDYVLRDEREIIERLKSIPGEHMQIWLVTDEECGFADLSYHCDMVEEFVNKYYTTEETKSFRNSLVRRLKRKEPS